jgi:hypothetical protein
MDPQQPQQPQGRPEPPPQQGGWNQAPPQQQSGWAPPPQQQSGWAPPPQQGGGWGQGGYYPAPPRPMGVTLTGIFYIIVGLLVGLAGLLLLLGGGLLGGAAGELEDFAGLGGMLGGMLVVGGILFVFVALLFLASGIGVFQGRNWARVLGIVLGVIFAVLGVLGILGSLGAGMDAGAMVWNVLFTALYALAAWALYKAAPYFAHRR